MPGKTIRHKKIPVNEGADAHAQVKRLESELEAVCAIGSALATSVGLDALFAKIVPHVTKMMSAGRTTLYLYDEQTREVWSKVAEGEEHREIRLSLGEGVAGWVARNRKSVKVENAYEEPIFNPRIDIETGFQTKTILAVPLLSRAGRLLGVLEVLNRQSGPFSDDDVTLLDTIAVQVAYAVENAYLEQQIIDQNRKLDAAVQRGDSRLAELDLLYQLEQEASACTNLDELLDSIILRACSRLRSDAGAVLLSDVSTGRLYFRGISGTRKDDLRMVTLEPGEGVVGWVAKTGEPLIINHPENDARCHVRLAQKVSYPVHAILAVPLIWDQKTIGAVEVLNPVPRDSGERDYDTEDLKVLTLIAGQVARAVVLTMERQAKLDTERLAAIGRMLAGVAHDLRNPMTAISGFAQLMAMDADPERREGRCKRILYQIDEMTSMIGDLLAFSRGETKLNPMVIDVEQLAREAQEVIDAYCKQRGVALHVAFKGGTVTVDVGRTRRILINLAKNAAEALAEGGELKVDLEEQHGGLILKVSDTGPGIPPDVRDRLFQPFVTSGKVHGTGLGLSIVKRFVDDHGGKIDFESLDGLGTSFIVKLPCIEAFSP